ncbi:MAG: FKBP-type peptidyl-prolyl cis-trans isomerase [Paludibacteraceae bacterium]|nr:FKBP-type peptidyl-prolyl cis-trans isomerase [Paludibacteraceae bacterium]
MQSKLLHITLVLLTILGVGNSCKQQRPQIPTYKSGRVQTIDSTTLHLIELNQRMALQADQQLIQYGTNGFTLDNLGFWVKGAYEPEQPVAIGEQIYVHMQVYGLDGVLYKDEEVRLEVGKQETITVITEMLPRMEKTQHVTILAPWYVAYGSMGSAVVPPYTNVRIELEIINL